MGVSETTQVKESKMSSGSVTYTKKVDEAVYNNRMDITKFETPQEKFDLLMALVDQFGVGKNKSQYQDIQTRLADYLGAYNEDGLAEPWT